MQDNKNNTEKYIIKKRFGVGNFNVFKIEANSRLKRAVLLGLEIYSLEDNYTHRIQKILGNSITTLKTKNQEKEEKSVKLFNLNISKRIFENNIYTYYFLNIPYKKRDERKVIYNKIFKNIKNEYDDIYILNSNSGEMFLFFAYLAKNFLEKNSSKNPLFVALDDYHKDIIEIFFPKANYINCNNLKITTTDNSFTYGKNRFFICFSKKHFEKTECAIQSNASHYYTEIKDTLGLTNENEPTISYEKEVDDNLIKKLNVIKLNLDNFILLAPEAKSCKELPISFWKNLAEKLKEKGYDVYLNIINSNNKINGLKSTKLNLKEIFYLAKKARAIVSLRSGLSEFLLPTKTPNFAIYTPFRRIKNSSFKVETLINGFSMHKIPFVDNSKIKEFNYEKYQTSDELINEILNNIDILGE
ncbi:MAG: hypothetical protein IJW73_03040 [Candidatus Gastranaerophilales bacterium]|nr:hypothetical protein [Candidatus Gastranaerophilales bacterium]